MATTSIITQLNTAVPAATEMNVLIPAGKRVIGVYLLRILAGNAALSVDDILIGGGIVTAYFDGLAIAAEHDLVVVFAEDIDHTPNTETLVDNGDGTFTFTSSDSTVTTYDSAQDLQLNGSVLGISDGNAVTLPSEFASEAALTARVANLENCLAKICKSCPSSLNGS